MILRGLIGAAMSIYNQYYFLTYCLILDGKTFFCNFGDERDILLQQYLDCLVGNIAPLSRYYLSPCQLCIDTQFQSALYEKTKLQANRFLMNLLYLKAGDANSNRESTYST